MKLLQNFTKVVTIIKRGQFYYNNLSMFIIFQQKNIINENLNTLSFSIINYNFSLELYKTVTLSETRTNTHNYSQPQYIYVNSAPQFTPKDFSSQNFEHL